MNIAVCEDEAADAGIICGYIQEHFDKSGFIGDIHTFTGGEELLNAFSPGAFDVVFMDIYMAGMDGLEAAKKMRERDPGFALVYITGSDDHAREAYSLNACAYVSKPIRQAEIDMAFQQCRAVFLKNARFIEVVSGRHSIKIPLIKILYIEVYNKDVLFHTAAGAVKTHMPLKEVKRQCSEAFLRCHRSYIVNMNQIDRLCEQDILMKNGDIVPMRQRGRQEIRNAYGDFLTDRLFESN